MNKKNRSWGDMHRNAWKMKEGHLPESKINIIDITVNFYKIGLELYQ